MFYFTKTFDGADRTITLPITPASVSDVHLKMGGAAPQQPGVSFTVSGNVLTLTFTPDAGETAWGHVDAVTEVEIGVPDPGTVGEDEINVLEAAGIRDKLDVYSKAEVDAKSGAVIQKKRGFYRANANITGAAAVIPFDDTAPQITEGVEIIAVEITPTAATSKLAGSFTCQAALNAVNTALSFAMFIDGHADAIGADYLSITSAGASYNFAFEAEVMPGNTLPRTISLRVGVSNAAHVARLNGTTSGRRFGGAMGACLTVEEIGG